ncbi:hypothetical protein [Luteimonas viscosa]|nr:hypothetical protein [Luteimonas viscosa]
MSAEAVIRDGSFVIREGGKADMPPLFPITNHQSPVTAPQGANQ